MTTVKLLAAAAGIAALAGAASPAAAQYPYGYGNNNGAGVVGSIINSVLGYGRYPYGNYGYGQRSYMSGQVAVGQCAAATEARLNNRSLNNQYNRWNPYNNPYNGWAVGGQGRVLGIERVSVRGGGRLRVTGVASSGRRYNQGWGYRGYAYNSQYGVPDLRFVCNADALGRVYNVNIMRFNRSGYRRY